MLIKDTTRALARMDGDFVVTFVMGNLAMQEKCGK